MSPGQKVLPHHVSDEVILLTELTPWIHRRRFERCVIVGSPPALLSGCYIEASRWLGLSDGSFITVDDPTDASQLPKGMVCFVECTFKDCEFQNFTVVGSAEQIKALRELFPLHQEPAHAVGTPSP